MKKSTFALLFAAILSTTSCGDTSMADNIISSASDASSQDQVTEEISSADPLAKELAGAEESTEAPAEVISADLSGDGYDIDLTQMSASMVYGQVYDMVNNGDSYLGQSVKVSGPFSYFQEADGREFFAVLVSDATACCAQGIEFVIDGYSYPDDYPEVGTEITVTGTFNYYKEGYYTYVQLLNAEMTVNDGLSWE